MGSSETDDKAKDNQPETAIASTSKPDATVVDGKLEEIIEGIPSPEDRHYLEKTFVGMIERSGAATLTADVATILADSLNKDNDHKFEFLCKKLEQEEQESIREHDLRTQQHKDRFSIVQPAFFFSLFILAACTGVGIWLCYIGKEVLGAALITAVWAGALGFLAGMGSADFFKNKTA